MTEKKWRPVHEIVLELLDPKALQDDLFSELTIVALARLYNRGAKAPKEAIPMLIEAFMPRMWEFLSNSPIFFTTVHQAIDALRAQLAEYEAKEKKENPPETCPDCGGKLQKICDPANTRYVPDSETAGSRKGDLRCTGECKKFYFLTDGVLQPGYND